VVQRTSSDGQRQNHPASSLGIGNEIRGRRRRGAAIARDLIDAVRAHSGGP
jgi:hypothetical protein